jgi:aminopeptidase N
LSIDSIFYNSQLVDYQIVGEESGADYHYEISPLSSDNKDTVDLLIYYSGNMTNEGGKNAWGGVHYSDSTLFALGVGFRNNYVSTTQHWLPCYDHPSDKALFYADFYLPEDYEIASNGDKSIREENGKKYHHFVMNYPTATYLLTFSIAKYTMQTLIINSIPIYVYAKEKDSVAATYAFKLTPEMLHFYSNLLKGYPFRSLGYVLTPIGSMESQTMINFDKNLAKNIYTKKDSMNLTAAHEMSHQWFGNSVTPYDYRDAWLNESFATYSESLWREYMFGYSAYITEQQTKLSNYINYIIPSEGHIPLYNFDRSDVSNYPTTIYYKGAIILGMLRYKLGDSVFFQALRQYTSDFQYQNMDILKAQQHFENVSGLNLSEFFEQWIYGIGYPKLDVELFVDTIEGKDYSKKIVINQVQIENWGIFRDVPVNITFKLSDGKLIDSVLILNEKNQSYLIDNIEIDTIYINNGSIVRSLLQVASVKTLKENSIFEDNNNLAEYLIYDNEIVIRIEEFLNDGKVILYDYLGRIIYSNQLTNMEIFSIPISNLEQGLYILIITEQGQVIKKQAISIVK